MTNDEQIAVVQNFFQKVWTGDFDNAVALLDPKVSYHVPGTHQLAGVFEGPEAVLQHLRDFMTLTGGTINVLQWEDWMVGVNHLAALIDLRVQREKAIHTFRIIVLVAMSKDDKIRRIDIFVSDPEAMDRFFAH